MQENKVGFYKKNQIEHQIQKGNRSFIFLCTYMLGLIFFWSNDHSKRLVFAKIGNQPIGKSSQSVSKSE